ncbi:MAG: anaerobic selenocysteine-containing dehydrogenase [Glaciecola sp.]|jgi:anaerobic selenocysteine-containing dehydrogenase
MSLTVPRTCHLCEAMCGLMLEIEGDRVVGVTGDVDDPLSKGYLCPKGAAIGDLHADPDRLRSPMLRQSDGTFVETDWETALDVAAAGLAKVQGEHGKDALAAYLGNPTVHSHGSLFMPLLLKAMQTRNLTTASTVDQRPQEMAAWLLYGHSALLPIPDLDRTDHLLILGANPAVSNGSLMTAPDARGRIKAIRARGGTVTVVDPRRTETSRIADEHVFIRPGTDALLLAAMVATIFEEGLERPGALAEFTDGLDLVAKWLEGFTPEAVAGVTGIDAATTRRLARNFAGAESGVVYGRLGICLQRTGTVASWLVNVLNIVTGNLDRPGGAMFTTPALDLVSMTAGGRYDRWQSRVNGRPEFSGEIPAAELAQEMLTPGDGQVRAFLVNAGNPVLSTPNGKRLDGALANLDFMVSIDIYVTETSRHADVILPPVSALERSHYDHAFHNLAVRNTVRWSPPVFAAPDGAMHDWEILVELARRLFGDPDRATTIARRFGEVKDPDQLVALGIAMGPWGKAARGEDDGIDFSDVVASEHGIDLGPLQPQLPDRLRSEGQRINLAPEIIADEVEAMHRMLTRDDDDRLVLIGRRQLRSNNSWMHNQERLVKGRDRCTALMHPDDASARQLVDGAPVCVRSTIGEIEVPLEISDEIMPGVVSIPHGWGHAVTGVGWKTAQANPGASVNDLTDTALFDPLSGNAALSEVRVTVTAAVPA